MSLYLLSGLMYDFYEDHIRVGDLAQHKCMYINQTKDEMSRLSVDGENLICCQSESEMSSGGWAVPEGSRQHPGAPLFTFITSH